MCKKEYVSLIIPSVGTLILMNYTLHEFVRLFILCISFFIFFWCFPEITRALYSRPLYIGDIENTKFELSYINTMNTILAIGCSLAIENWIIKSLANGRSYLDITAAIGGNITFFATIQNYLAKGLLTVCHKCKLHEEARSRRNSEDHEDTLSDGSIAKYTGTNVVNPLHSDPEAKSGQTTPRSATTSELHDNIAILTERLAERDQILDSLNIKPLGSLSK